MDIDDIFVPINSWAAYHFRKSPEDLKEGKIRIDIDTSKLHEKIQPPLPKDMSKGTSQYGSGVVFESRYTNKTNVAQEHTFIMERTTEATVTSSLSKGYTKNGDVGINIGVPEPISRKTGGFGSEVTVGSDDTSTTRYALSWSVDTKVTVPAGNTTVAKLSINEKTSKFTFKRKVIMKGRIRAKLVDVTSGEVLDLTTGGIAAILNDKKYNGGYRPSSDVARIDLESNEITWNVEGSLDFKFGVSQDVEVNYE